MKLHLGCGNRLLEGWVNVDVTVPRYESERHPTFIRYNLDGAAQKRMPWATDTVELVYGAHLMEHLRNPLPMMQELWRVCKPGAIAVFECPYGSSDDAFEDPTHVRPIFPGFWAYFAQPTYWRADYGYTGDWELEVLELEMSGELMQDRTDVSLVHLISTARNVVLQQRAVLHCIKPRRPAMGDGPIPAPRLSFVPVRAARSLVPVLEEAGDGLLAEDMVADEESAEGHGRSENTEDSGNLGVAEVDAEGGDQGEDGSGEGDDAVRDDG